MLARDPLVALDEYFDAWNGGDLDRLMPHVDENFVLEGDALPERVVGREGLRRHITMWRTAFPDLRFRLEDVFARSDGVTAEWVATGTHLGPLDALSASGRAVTLRGCTVTRLRDGKLISSRTYWDARSLWSQLGAES